MSDAKDREALAARLRETREYLNLSQKFVAEQTGIPRSAISEIENGKRQVSGIELKRLSDLYRMPVAYFLGQSADQLLNASQGSSADSSTVLARLASELTEQDRNEVVRFALFLSRFGDERSDEKPPPGVE